MSSENNVSGKDSVEEEEGSFIEEHSSEAEHKEDPHEVVPESTSEEVPQEIVPKDEVIQEEIPAAGEDTIFDELEEGENTQLAQIDFGIVEIGRWLLKVIGGPNNGAEFSMQTGSSYILGTDPSNCDIVFHDTSVSRQHAKITVNQNDTITIQDLQSRNGTFVDGETIGAPHSLESNIVVTLGTTSFVVYDREGEMQTIISPLMPSIVKKLKEESNGSEEEKIEEEVIEEEVPSQEGIAAEAPPPKKESSLSGAIFGIITLGVLGLTGFGIYNLFKEEPIAMVKPIDTQKILEEAMHPFPAVKYYFTPKTGQLTLVGHVLTRADKNRMKYNLENLEMVKSTDDSGVVVDENVYNEMNQILERKQWKGINMTATEPGKFLLTGSLKTRKEGESLTDYITANFPYLDTLENRVVVEEDLLNTTKNSLNNKGIRDVSVNLTNGELTLAGGIPADQIPALKSLVEDLKKIKGVRNVKNYVSELAPEEAIQNISSRYKVTGVSRLGDKLNVVINGRILFIGDSLDGMVIKEINNHSIVLHKEGIVYRIDF